MRAALALACVAVMLTGCSAMSAGSGGGCTLTTVFSVYPATATADHVAASPGNQQKFSGSIRPTAAAGCPIPQWIELATPVWTNPDPLDISIDSAADPTTNGVAVCKNATAGSVTLTAVSGTGTSQQTASVQLTCQ